MKTNETSSPWLHRLAVLTACCTFPLIFLGGLVTSHHAGMSVPDWPNSYGYNMFLFPPRLWIGGILYEHTHRLMATVVGFVSIILTVVAWQIEPRRWVRWVATAVLGAVVFQGVLGGLRVVLVKLDLAIVHACFAQAFFLPVRFYCDHYFTMVGGRPGSFAIFRRPQRSAVDRNCDQLRSTCLRPTDDRRGDAAL